MSTKTKVFTRLKQSPIVNTTINNRIIRSELYPLKLYTKIYATSNTVHRIGFNLNRDDISPTASVNTSSTCFIKYCLLEDGGYGCIDITVNSKDYTAFIYSNSMAEKKPFAYDIEISIVERDKVSKTIGNIEYIVTDIRYPSKPTTTPPPTVTKPKYDTEKDYILVGNIECYKLWKQNDSIKCLWVDTSRAEAFYPMSSLQSAVEFFALSGANKTIKLTIDQVKEKLGIKKTFYQDFSQQEHEKKAIDKLTEVLKKKTDFNELMKEISILSFARMDEFAQKDLAKQFASYADTYHAE